MFFNLKIPNVLFATAMVFKTFVFNNLIFHSFCTLFHQVTFSLSIVNLY